MDWLLTIHTAPIGSEQWSLSSVRCSIWTHWKMAQHAQLPMAVASAVIEKNIKWLNTGHNWGTVPPDDCDSYPFTADIQSKIRIQSRMVHSMTQQDQLSIYVWAFYKFTFGAFGAVSIEPRTIFLLSMPSRSTCRSSKSKSVFQVDLLYNNTIHLVVS